MEITHKRGSTLNLPMQVKKDGVGLSLVGKTPIYLIKAFGSDADADAVLSFTVGSGFEITNAATGHFSLKKTAAQMDLPRNYYAGFLQIRDDASGEIIELPDEEDVTADVWKITRHGVLSTA